MKVDMLWKMYIRESTHDIIKSRVMRFERINHFTLTPRDILQTKSPSALTLATTTSAPNRARTSVMHVVSISSESSAMGTKTRFLTSPSDADVLDMVLINDVVENT